MEEMRNLYPHVVLRIFKQSLRDQVVGVRLKLEKDLRLAVKEFGVNPVALWQTAAEQL